MTFLHTASRQDADCLKWDVISVSILLHWVSCVAGSVYTDTTEETKVTLLRVREDTESNSDGKSNDLTALP